jgi:3-oxoacyl-[acyl-carrier protein] reductase
MTKWLEGKVAVITGSGGGIGRATALEMANQGAKVVVADIGKDANGAWMADNVVKEIVSNNGVAAASYGNVATPEGAAGIVETATKNFGRLDILVNCAGNFKIAPTIDMTDELWNSIMDVHLRGHFNCIRAAARVMIPQKSGGRIINISSRSAGIVPGPKFANSAYCSAKAGILGLTSSNAVEFEPYGITVNAVLPAADTALFPGKRGSMGGLPNSDDCLQPEYVAPMITYLATDKAQSITGRYIYVCGKDVCIFARPLQTNTATLLHSENKWTLEGLDHTVSALLGS